MTLETITLRMVRLSRQDKISFLGEILIRLRRLLAHNETSRPRLASRARGSSHSTICSSRHSRTVSQKQGGARDPRVDQKILSCPKGPERSDKGYILATQE